MPDANGEGSEPTRGFQHLLERSRLSPTAGDRVYAWNTEPGGRGATVGSACLRTTFQAPSSRRKIVVTRTATGDISSAPSTLTRNESISTMSANSGEMTVVRV